MFCGWVDTFQVWEFSMLFKKQLIINIKNTYNRTIFLFYINLLSEELSNVKEYKLISNFNI
jgi:hypothetical protein